MLRIVVCFRFVAEYLVMADENAGVSAGAGYRHVSSSLLFLRLMDGEGCERAASL